MHRRQVVEEGGEADSDQGNAFGVLVEIGALGCSVEHAKAVPQNPNILEGIAGVRRCERQLRLNRNCNGVG